MKQAMSSVVLTVPRTEEHQIKADEAKAKAVHAGRWIAAA